jgi:hypothetical protein
LVQIARIIVVYRTPDEVSEITRRFFGSCGRLVDSVKFGERLRREIGQQPSGQHGPPGDVL